MTRQRKSDIVAGLSALLVIALSVACVLATSGCVYRGAKLTEGTDLSLGISVPSTGGSLQFDVMNYLTGFRLGVAENAILKVKYTVAETNSYLWGAVTTAQGKVVDATVEPCEAGGNDNSEE